MKKSKPIGLKTLVVIILTSLFMGGIGGALTNEYIFSYLYSRFTEGNSNSPIVKRVEEKKVYIEESSIINAVKKVAPSVVSIVITKDLPLYYQRVSPFDNFFFDDPFLRDFFPGFRFETPQKNQPKNKPKSEKRKIGGGSGFIFTADGLVLTNKHVVSDKEANYTVILNNGTTYEAEVLSRDIFNDIAVLKLKDKDGKKPDSLPVVEFGDSSSLQVGQRVVAIGNALAEYENTVTSGVISAKGRQITASDSLGRGSETLNGLIQTDASINPGNSGGPLVNLEGQVIGVNTAIANNAQGIGFAIPVDDVKYIIDSIKKHGKIIRPMLGVRYMMLDKNKAQDLKIDITEGALLIENTAAGEMAVVKGSAADKAGLLPRDVITEIDGEKLTIDNDLRKIISKHQVGDKLKLKVWRNGKKFEVAVKLEEAK